MSLGTNYARGSRKTYLIMLIAGLRNAVPADDELKRMRRMKVDDLYELYRAEKGAKEKRERAHV